VNEVNPVSDTLKEIVAVGRTVVADRALTQFLDQTASGFSFDTVGVNDVVEVSGEIQADGRVWADQIVKMAEFVPEDQGAEEVVTSGLISENILPNSFNVESASVNVTPDTALIKLPNGIGIGMIVRIQGTLTNFEALRDLDSTSFTTITATSIGLVRRISPPDRAAATFDGLVKGFDAGTSTFLLNGFTVNAGLATFRPATLAQSIGNGAHVIASGPIVESVLQADTVSLPGF
jgi:hypothetical protein